jgi:hypothetical protein
MTTTISEHQARLYEFVKAHPDRWFTTLEISVETNIPGNNVKLHCARFEEIGIFERIRISPAHAFRLDGAAAEHAPKMVGRLDEAVQIFADRRMAWLKREEGVVRRLDARLAAQTSAATSAEMSFNPASKPTGIDSASDAPDEVGGETIALEGPLPVERATPHKLKAGTAEAPVMSSEQEVAPTYGSTKAVGNTLPPNVTAGRGGKVDLLLAMVAREEGASLDELVVALGNLAHSIRASISVESRKRGLKIECVNSRYYLRSAL